MYFMLPAAKATSGNHGNGIYHNISLFLGIFKNVPVVSFDLRCQYMDAFILHNVVLIQCTVA